MLGLGLIATLCLLFVKVYYDAKAKKLLEQTEANHGRNGVKNNGYDNANYDYIVQNDSGEIFNDRYIVKHKLGKV
jgi:hypothetical protein